MIRMLFLIYRKHRKTEAARYRLLPFWVTAIAVFRLPLPLLRRKAPTDVEIRLPGAGSGTGHCPPVCMVPAGWKELLHCRRRPPEEPYLRPGYRRDNFPGCTQWEHHCNIQIPAGHGDDSLPPDQRRRQYILLLVIADNLPVSHFSLNPSEQYQSHGHFRHGLLRFSG